MLNFITTKKDSKSEYRFYADSAENVEGTIIYKGHKLGVEDNILVHILEYRMERFNNRIYIQDYNSDGKWFSGTTTESKEVIDKSYESLQQKAEKTFGKFRKIIITKI
jgi:hypothetical protein